MENRRDQTHSSARRHAASAIGMTRAVSFEQVSIRGVDLNLAADVAGPVGAPTILFLHGSGQTRQSWSGALSQAIKLGYRAVSLDLRGHGDSDWSVDGQYTLERFAADVRHVIEQLGDEPILVG